MPGASWTWAFAVAGPSTPCILSPDLCMAGVSYHLGLISDVTSMMPSGDSVTSSHFHYFRHSAVSGVMCSLPPFTSSLALESRRGGSEHLGLLFTDVAPGARAGPVP